MQNPAKNKIIFVITKITFVVAALSLISSLLIYRAAIARRSHAEFGITLISPNAEYRINKYYISAGDPMIVLFKVYDGAGKILLAEYTRELWPGAWFEHWTCNQQHCTEFQYSIGEVETISLPTFNLSRENVFRHGVIGLNKLKSEARHVRY